MVEERDRLTAQISGIGAPGILALRNSRVLVVGAGGLGSPVLAYLTAAGVGTIGIADGDVLEESNLQRQVIHPARNLGLPKATSAKQTIAALNPAVQVITHQRLEAENAADIISSYDLVMDCVDNFPSKYLLSDVCSATQTPEIWGTLVGMSFQVSVFTDGFTLRDIYPQIPPPGTTVTSAQDGVLGAVCGQAGSVMAGEAIKFITGAGQSLRGSLLIVDAANCKWDVIKFASAKVEEAESRPS